MRVSLDWTGKNLSRIVEKSLKKIKPFGHSEALKKYFYTYFAHSSRPTLTDQYV